jgi:hypothetical protein
MRFQLSQVSCRAAMLFIPNMTSVFPMFVLLAVVIPGKLGIVYVGPAGYEVAVLYHGLEVTLDVIFPFADPAMQPLGPPVVVKK